jgi:pimeloyl-ACP methyl ester carboxylesterase
MLRHTIWVLALLLVWPALAQDESPPAYTPIFTEEPCVFDPPEPSIVCGRLLVPENRDNPSGRKVSLAVAILPALLEPSAPDPVIYLEGGPGFSAFYRLYEWIDHPLRANRDFILIDQRGMGFSEPSLNCPEIENGRIGPYGSSVEYCRWRIVEEDRIDINQYHSAASATDIRDLAAALKLEQVNLYGISYGSRLALTVIRDHPEIVRSAVLDAVFPPEADLIEDRIFNRFQAFEAMFNACSANPACAAAYPGLEDNFYAMIERYNENPLPVPGAEDYGFVPPELTGYDVVDALFLGLYNTPGLPMIPEGLTRLHRGQGRDDILFGYFMTRGLITPEEYRQREVPETPTIRDSQYVRIYENRAGDVEYAEGAYLSINCAEEMPYTDGNAVTNADSQRVPPVLWDYLSLDVSSIMFGCNTWNVAERDLLETERVVSDIPVLLAGGAYDPITSVTWMMSARQGLPNSKLVIFTYGGHGVTVDNPCGVGLVVAHFNTPDLAPDTSCATGDIPFFTGD